jgi:MFS family permease
MTTILTSNPPIFLPLFALFNGMYNCFFWIIQRVLFFETISPQNSGQKFGNFQIFVFIILKAGIFTGGILLEKNGFLSVYLVSGFIALLGILLFTFQTQSPRLPRALLHDSPLSLSHLIHFRDRFRSKLIFAIDGVFLFLESYFWLISLFLIMRESFWHLGILVIILTLTFSIFFFIIKNTIDRISKQKVYVLAVFLYATSWLLRGWLPDQLPLPQLFTYLVIITFCTSFFRLAFNKRFFDLAKQTTAYHYLFMKSYYSQFFIAVSFAVLGLVFSHISAVEHALKYSYWFAGCIALIYLLYKPFSKR